MSNFGDVYQVTIENKYYREESENYDEATYYDKEVYLFFSEQKARDFAGNLLDMVRQTATDSSNRLLFNDCDEEWSYNEDDSIGQRVKVSKISLLNTDEDGCFYSTV